MQETWVQSLVDGFNALEKEMATHSSNLAWRIPGQRSLAGYSPCGRKSWTWLSVKPPPMTNRCQLDKKVVKWEIWSNTVGEWVGRAGDWESSTYEKWKLVTQSRPTLRFHGPQPLPLLCPWISTGKSTGVGCHFLLPVSNQPGDQA